MENKKQKLDALKILKGVLFTLFLAAFFMAWFFFDAPRGRGVADLKTLEDEFIKISPPAYAYANGGKHASSKVSSALVQQFYLTKMAEIDVKEYYESQLFLNGWSKFGINNLKEWTYCKGRLRADLVPQAEPSGYTFSISWHDQNSSHCR